MAMDVESRVRRMYEEFWNKGDMGVINDILAPDYSGHLNMFGNIDRDAMTRIATTFRNAFPDLHYTVEDIVVAGDTVVARWTAAGTQKGELMGIPASNNRGETSGIDIFRFEGDRVKEHWGTFDALTMMQNIGAVSRREMGAEQPGSV